METIKFLPLQVRVYRKKAACAPSKRALHLLCWSALTHFALTQSCVDVSFWSELGDRKLDEYQLSETAVDITGA
jgi:hypothetical protein